MGVNNITSTGDYSQINTNDGAKATAKIASGTSINSASDDAAGLTISQSLKTQVNGMNMASRNSQDAISMIQTADSSLSGVSDSLQRMRELSVQASNNTYTDGDRAMMNEEFMQLKAGIDQVSSSTQFNNQNLLDGSLDATMQTGANAGNSISIRIGTSMNSSGLGIDKSDIATGKDAMKSINEIDSAMQNVSDVRSKLGAQQNGLQEVISNLDTTSSNTMSADSQISDSNIASLMVEKTKNNILNQFSTAIMANANQQSGNVLWLLR